MLFYQIGSDSFLCCFVAGFGNWALAYELAGAIPGNIRHYLEFSEFGTAIEFTQQFMFYRDRDDINGNAQVPLIHLLVDESISELHIDIFEKIFVSTLPTTQSP